MTDYTDPDYAPEVEAIRAACAELGEPAAFRPAAAADLAWLSSQGYPPGVLAFFAVAEPAAEIEIEGVLLVPIRLLRDANSVAMPGLVTAPLGYPVVAKTVSGDVYCVATAEVDAAGQASIYLLPHDQLGAEVDLPGIQAAARCLAPTWRRFLQRFAAADLPYDVGQARWYA